MTMNGGKTRAGNESWSTWDVLFASNNRIAWNDCSSCNRQGRDGGVIETWGTGRNNVIEYNAVHDNEGYSGLSLIFTDDFSPYSVIQRNVLYENNCASKLGTNCAVFMLKSLNTSARDNIVSDMNYTFVFEPAFYNMPCGHMSIERNLLWNTTQRSGSSLPTSAESAYILRSTCIPTSFSVPPSLPLSVPHRLSLRPSVFARIV